MSGGSRTALACVVLVASTFVAFSPVRDNGFVAFDDPRYITANQHVRDGLTWDGVVWAFTTTHAYNWHPLTWLSHMLDVELFGLDPGLHHLSNVVRHAVAAALLLVVLHGLSGAFWRSTFVAFVFALHPLRVESVAWASERKDVLGALFWILTMAAYGWYAKRPAPGRYGLLCAVFVLGLLAKPMLVTLPFVLLLLDFWPLGRLRLGQATPRAGSVEKQRPSSSRPRKRKQGARSESQGGPRDHGARLSVLVLEKLPLLLATLGAIAVTLVAQRGVVQTAERFPIEARMGNAVLAYVRYLGKLLWPERLAVFYPWRSIGLAAWEVWAAAALIVLLTVLALRHWRRGYPVTGWFWYLGTLVPVIGLVQVGMQSIADRYSYLPGIGVVVVATWAVAQATEKRPRTARAASAAGVALLAVLASLTWRQAHVWRDDETLFRHAVEVTEDSYWAHYNLGLTLLGAGRSAEAVPHFEEAVRLEPTSREALTNLGVSLEETGQAEKAVAAFQRAAEIDPENRFAVRHLTRALVTNDRPYEAAAILQNVVRRWPEDPELHYSLGIARLELGQLVPAIESLQRSVALDAGSAAAHNALGIALARRGDLAAAHRHFTRAVELDPSYGEARRNLERLRVRGGEQRP